MALNLIIPYKRDIPLIQKIFKIYEIGISASKTNLSPFNRLTAFAIKLFIFLNNLRRYSYCDAIIRNISNNNSISTNINIIPNFDIA